MNHALEFNRLRPQESNTIVLDSFVCECIQLNIESVTNTLSVTKHINPIYVIETYVFNIVAAIMADKTKEEILTDLSGGGIFLMKNKLTQGFREILNV